MQVVKRDGRTEQVKFDKITARIDKLCYGLDPNYVSAQEVAIKVINGLYDGVTTQELDNLAAETAATLTTKHPDFSKLAARIAVSNLHKTTSKSFSATMKRLYSYVDAKTGYAAPLISKETWKVIKDNAAVLDEAIVYDRDFGYDYFGFKTLERSYLMKIDGKIVERPQHMLMRVAVGIHGEDIGSVIETYNLLSEKWFTHATPTLFNAGTPKPQLSSCFLLTMKEDSIDGIYDTLKQCAKISQSAGGIGLSIHNIRAAGSYIRGTGGNSNGIVPMLRNFDMTARYVDQGGGKRKGSFAIYLEPWHADIFEFLDLKKNHGKEEIRARDLFYAMWIPDLFMERVESDGQWSLFCPNEAPGLADVYGEEFNRLYAKYESEGKARKTIKAQDLWFEILKSQIETGTPYMLYKDAANKKSNQKNLGTIKSSNLCFTGDTIVAVADGRNGVSIKDLANESSGTIKFPVYSARPKKNRKGWKTEIKNAVAFKTGTKPVVEVLLSNGDIFKCTSDHEIALAQGGYVKAKDSVGKSLAKFFTFTSVNNGNTPYRHINSMSDGHSKQHLLIYDFHNNKDRFGHHVDHIDKNSVLFDSINNLQLLPYKDHLKKTGFEVSGKNNMVYRIRNFDNFKHNLSAVVSGKLNPRYSGITNEELVEHGRKILEEYGELTIPNYLNYIERTGIRLPKSFSKYRFSGKFSQFKSHVINNKPVVEPDAKIKIGKSDNDLNRKNYIKTNLNDLIVVSVTEVGVEDVYDLTVEDNHNFYIITSTEDSRYLNSQGVLVHNCSEIIEYSSPEEVAVCNLASISLPKFVTESGEFDHQKLYEVTKVITKNLNRVIDVNYYPVPETRVSNMRHRPIGIGVQGLADAFLMMRLPFDSEGAKIVNRDIHETIYYGAMEASMEAAKKEGPYETFKGSPVSKGIFQFDMWGVTPNSGRWDWNKLKEQVKQHGVRNSLLLAPMPTASTSQILGNNECFEPYTSNIYTRRTLSGEFIVANKFLMYDLIKLGLWDEKMRQKLIAANGSVQAIPEIPQDLKDLYKTVWEISQKVIIDMSADRGAYICQSQSLNIHLMNANFAKLTSMHFYAWKKGLKTGMYYLRTNAAADAIKFTLDKAAVEETQAKQDMVCSLDNPENCEACGS